MSKPAEQLVTCPDCGQGNILPRGLAPHRKSKHCRDARPRKPSPRPAAKSGPAPAGRKGVESKDAPAPGHSPKALVPAGPRRVLSLGDLDVMPSTPQGARSLKELTLPELEAADRALRAMPERLEKLSGITAVLNGLVLAEIKGKLAHKQFTPWLVANYGKSKRTAQLYMQLGAAFSDQKRNGCAFDQQQLTLALLDATAEQSLDLADPVVQAVEKWADGRSYKTLIADETGDGRAANPGGFRPNAQHLAAWLKHEYPDRPEWQALEVFSELPAEVQQRFKAEGERYWERLTKAEREEIEREAAAQDWLTRGPVALAAVMDRGLEDFATIDQLRALDTLLGDYRAQVRRKIEARAKPARIGIATL